MIEKLSIKNFKSIKEMAIDCKRINLFIGEPNTGKSNILEALGLASWIGHYNFQETTLNDFARFQTPADLFFDSLVDKKIIIELPTQKASNNTISLGYSGKYYFDARSGNISIGQHFDHEGKELVEYPNRGNLEVPFTFIKYYKYHTLNNFPIPISNFLLPPRGSNLLSTAIGNKEIRDMMAQFYESYDLKVMLKPKDNTIEIFKQKDNVVISYPYTSTSDTLQRMIFFSAAMDSNKNSTLVFEEPESFAFPYYTKHLGECIAFDNSNQYFISTHNPYLLYAIMEKTQTVDLNVCITYLKDYQTKIKQLSEDEIPLFLDSDPFFNLGHFIEEDEE